MDGFSRKISFFWQRKGTGTPLFPNTGSPILRIFSPELSAADACFRAWKQNPSCLCLGGQIGCLASGQNSPFLTAVGGGECVPAGNRPSPSGAFASSLLSYSILFYIFSFLFYTGVDKRQPVGTRMAPNRQPAGSRTGGWQSAQTPGSLPYPMPNCTIHHLYICADMPKSPVPGHSSLTKQREIGILNVCISLIMSFRGVVENIWKEGFSERESFG